MEGLADGATLSLARAHPHANVETNGTSEDVER
jgi:hypothetical protein